MAAAPFRKRTTRTVVGERYWSINPVRESLHHPNIYRQAHHADRAAAKAEIRVIDDKKGSDWLLPLQPAKALIGAQ
jgi:hypothetical protein